jgi:2-polyprenyl-6-methoxyphenol hydroxylase-like FAD-dependent oxidoreductase
MAKGRSKHGVLIAGGGIGGLTLSLALARRGMSATVLERSAFADETGAGIQLGPNATRALRDSGLLDGVEARAFRPEALWIFDGCTGKRLAAMPLGREAEDRYGAPYLTLHRADLHTALLQACQDQASVELRPRFEVTAVEEQAATVMARGADGHSADGSALIGADGLWSAVRTRLAPHAAPRFAGRTAWRAILPQAGLSRPFDAPVVGLWLGPGAHLVHYPVRGGQELNLVAVVDSGHAERGWGRHEDRAALLASFTRWSNAPQSLLEMAAGWRAWSLYRLPPLRQWSIGRIALLGDAAHPVLPFLAQGAALAIEDAITLAGALAAFGGDPSLAFASYARLRWKRARTVQRMSARMGRIYHLGAVGRIARNAMLQSRHPESLLSAFDWLYGPEGLRP